MKKSDAGLIVCLLLMLMLASTGMSGFIQVKLDLHRITIHKYSAYAALLLAAVHVLLHLKGMINRVRNLFKR